MGQLFKNTVIFFILLLQIFLYGIKGIYMCNNIEIT